MRKLLRLCLAAALSLVAAVSLFPVETKPEAAPVPAPDVTRLLADFRTNIPGIFTSGSWQGRLALSSSGFVVQGNKGADGKGEMGQNLPTPADLSKETFIELAIGVGAKNEVPEVTIGFTDVGGIQYTTRIRINQVLPQQAVWFRVKRSDFKLNDWQGIHVGKTIDWTQITQWHLQGDWTTPAPFHVMFIALRTRQ